MLDKIKTLKEMLDKAKVNADIEVDGGITQDNVDMVLSAGANVIVTGTAVFKGDLRNNIDSFQKHFKQYQLR
jgi:ribulose-phosphate 3-epimerase